MHFKPGLVDEPKLLLSHATATVALDHTAKADLSLVSGVVILAIAKLLHRAKGWPVVNLRLYSPV